MTGPRPGNSGNSGNSVNSAELAALYNAEEIPKKGAHARKKETLILFAGIGVSLVTAGLGLFFALSPDTEPTTRTMAAGWVGVVLGQAKKVWGSE
jgi:hypothetical protein